MKDTAAIVLAAGKSERMGQPKALLPWDGRTFIEVLLETIAASAIGDAVVVLGHHRDAILDRVRLPRWVDNPDYERGMTTSFQAGIRALGEVSGAVLFLVDHPAPGLETIGRILEPASRGRIVVPRFGGRRGHPVFFGGGPLREVLDLGPGEGANQVVRRQPARVIEVDVDDPAVVADLDTPEELATWQEAQDRKS